MGNERGGIWTLLIVGVILTIFLSLLSMIPTFYVATARVTLESQGYVVLTAGEYASLSAKIDALKASADAAVVNAVVAATTANETLNTLLLHNENEVFIYPDSTTDNVTFTAGTPLDTFGAWTEIVSANGTALSSKFLFQSGYLVEMVFRDYSASDKICLIEIGYGTSNVTVSQTIGRVKVKTDFTYVLTLKSVRIPA